MTLIETRDLSVRLDGKPVLHGIDFEISAGEIVTVVGPNGSGKTTLLRALIGAVPLSGGAIRRMPGLRLGYVPQKLHLDPSLPIRVVDFMHLPIRVSDEHVTEALGRTGAVGLAERQLSDLSGGQMQRVLLARALLSRPQILLLDEPTQGLDQPGSAAFYLLIEEIARGTGAAILMVSHELHVVMSASDRVICLNGHVCCAGTPEHVSSAPAYREMFGTGTGGALALYRHDHDHDHDGQSGQACDHDHHPTAGGSPHAG